jgi:hypothetical protein
MQKPLTKQKIKSIKFPSDFQALLWSKNINKIDFQKDRIYVIHQILAYGDMKDIHILFKIYPESLITEIFLNYPLKIYTKPVFRFVKSFILNIKDNLAEEKYVKDFPRSIK